MSLLEEGIYILRRDSTRMYWPTGTDQGKIYQGKKNMDIAQASLLFRQML